MKTEQDFGNIHCSQEITQGSDSQIICLSVINTLLAIKTLVGNTLILIAVGKETSLCLPSKVLLRNLVASDLCVGFTELVFVAYLVSILQGRWELCHYFHLAGVIGASISIQVSLCTSAAISVDRLLALLLGLRYRQVVTLRRVYIVVITFWVLIGVCSPITEIVNVYIPGIVSWTASMMCLITTLLCYTGIFFRLRQQQTQVHNNPAEPHNQTIPLNISRYRKTVSTALWLQLALVFCYFPYMFLAPFAISEIENTHSPAWYLALHFTLTLVFLNSTLNPILYCWKIKEVRRIVKDMFSCS